MIQPIEQLIDLSISIVNTSNWVYLQPCLESIIKNVKNINYEILVVDNVSTDGSVEKINEQFPQIILSENKERYGFAKNNNINIKRSSGKYIMLLNDDTLVLPGTIETILPIFESDPTIGVVGCKMISPDGKIQVASSRKFRTLLSEMIIESGLSRIFPQSFIEPHDELTEIDIPSEAGMVLRREVIDEVGLLDEQFFMFGEGPDWCRRIKRANWKIVLMEKCPVIHFGGATNKRTSVKMHVQFYKSTYLFFRKDNPLKGTIYRLMILMIVVLKSVALSFFSKISSSQNRRFNDIKPYYNALIDFMAQKINDKDYPFPLK